VVGTPGRHSAQKPLPIITGSDTVSGPGAATALAHSTCGQRQQPQLLARLTFRSPGWTQAQGSVLRNAAALPSAQPTHPALGHPPAAPRRPLVAPLLPGPAPPPAPCACRDPALTTARAMNSRDSARAAMATRRPALEEEDPVTSSSAWLQGHTTCRPARFCHQDTSLCAVPQYVLSYTTGLSFNALSC
jgi:hypothetical protein